MRPPKQPYDNQGFMTVKFVSSETFPEDEYTKEIVYLCLEDKYRVAYVRKQTKNGALFWAVATASATKNGKKEYFPGFLQDSNFLERDIKDFLESRSWEKEKTVFASNPKSMSDMVDDTPF